METLAEILGCKGRTVHVVAPEATVMEAIDEMCRARVGALVVASGDTIVGIFSERDLMLRVVLDQRDAATTRVGEVMTTGVISVPLKTSSHEAMAVMTNSRVRHLPVTDGTRLAGLVSIGDLVRWTVASHERVIDELEWYVAGRYPG
jgi:CBS domain-containing protein